MSNELIRPARRQLIVTGAAVAAQVMLPQAARAQAAYPAKQLRLIVPFPAAGGADLGARQLAGHLAAALGKPVVIENRGGADGAIAAQEAARAAPDGGTMYFATASSLSYLPAVRKTLAYDTVADFAPVARFVTFTFFLMVHESIPGRNLEEVAAYVRANPGKVTYGTGNSTGILGTAQLAKSANLDMVHVPYKGEAQAVVDISSGRVQMMWATPAVTALMMRDNKTRPVAVLLPSRSALMPDVPTIAEAGQPLVDISPWGAMVVPAKTPREIIDRLNRELNTIMLRPDMREQMDKLGLPMKGSTPEECGTFLKDQLAAWNRAARQANLPME